MTTDNDPTGSIRVWLIWSPGPRQVEHRRLTLSAGATVLQALQTVWSTEGCPDPDGVRCVGIWGRAVGLNHVLRDQDRIECYRPLTADPKESRRQRYQAHVARWGKRRPTCTRSG